MVGSTPKKFRVEEIRLCEGWAAFEYDMSMGEYVELHATPEYLEYHKAEVKRLKELQDKGIMV